MRYGPGSSRLRHHDGGGPSRDTATSREREGDGQAERDIRDDGHAYIPASALPADRFEAYLEAVFRPVLSDAVLVVAAAGATTFIDDLRDEGPLLRDLTTALFEPQLSPDLLATQAAREWLDLAPTNQKVLRFLGYI